MSGSFGKQTACKHVHGCPFFVHAQCVSKCRGKRRAPKPYDVIATKYTVTVTQWFLFLVTSIAPQLSEAVK